MNPKEILGREDTLASWRLATLLAFNGFLISFLGSDLGSESSTKVEYNFIWNAIPVLGVFISISVMFVAFLSAKIKYNLHIKWESGKSPITKTSNKTRYFIEQALGPYILSSILFTAFWVILLILRCAKCLT